MEEWKNGFGSWGVFDWIAYLTLEWMAPYDVFPGFGGEDEGVVMWLCGYVVPSVPMEGLACSHAEELLSFFSVCSRPFFGISFCGGLEFGISLFVRVFCG